MLESEAIMKRTAHLLALLVLFSTVSAQYVEPWGATRALRMKEAAKLHDELSDGQASPLLVSGRTKVARRRTQFGKRQDYGQVHQGDGLAGVRRLHGKVGLRAGSYSPQ